MIYSKTEDDVASLKEWNKVCDFISSIPELNLGMKLLRNPNFKPIEFDRFKNKAGGNGFALQTFKTDVVEGSPAGTKWYSENFPSEGDFLLITPVERHADFCAYGTVGYRCHGIDCYNEYRTFEEFKDILGVFVIESKLFDESEEMELFEKSVQETEF